MLNVNPFTMRILGTDPGRHGALALIDTGRGTLQVWAMPIAARALETIVKHLVDEERLADIVRVAAPDEAWIEDVWSRAGEGPVGAFSFGDSKGVLRGCLGALGVPRRYVPPARWKTDLKVPANKQQAKARAHALLPACAGILTSEGKAEAALISLYGCLSANIVQPRLAPARS